MKLLHVAGLFNVWHIENSTIYSYSIITMESNDTLNWLHHRMPAILESEEQINVCTFIFTSLLLKIQLVHILIVILMFQAWLDIENVNSDMAISYLLPAKILKWHPVSTNVNNSRYKLEDCNKKITLAQKKSCQVTLTSWFANAPKRKGNNEEEPKPKKSKK